MNKSLVLFLSACLAGSLALAEEASLPLSPEPAPPPDITTRSGITYERCEVQRVESDGSVVFHAKGVAKIPFADLPEVYQKRYGYTTEHTSDLSRNVAEARARDAARRDAERQRMATSRESEHRTQAARPRIAGESFDGVITQVLPNGALMLEYGVWVRMTRGRGYRGMSTQPIFVEGDFSGSVDEERWTGTIYPSGTYQFTSTSGAVRTVKKYSVSPIR